MGNAKKSAAGIIGILTLGCLFMAFVDGIWQPGYGVKSLLKIAFFFGIPCFYAFENRDINLRALFQIKSKGMIRALFFGIGVYAFILAAYFTIGTFFDFSEVTKALNENVGVNRDNFVLVALYISFVNSLLEEFFFRGFIFLNLKRMLNRKAAYLISSAAFAVYHVAMMLGWFSILLFLLLFTALAVAGMIFNRLNETQENIYTSWFVHMFANFAINTVGFILFDII